MAPSVAFYLILWTWWDGQRAEGKWAVRNALIIDVESPLAKVSKEQLAQMHNHTSLSGRSDISKYVNRQKRENENPEKEEMTQTHQHI